MKVPHTLALILVLALGLAAAAAVAAAQGGTPPATTGGPAYSVTDLPTLGGPTSAANAINDVGQIVGQAETAAGTTHVVLRHRGTPTNVGTPVGTPAIGAAGRIAAAGQIVGGPVVELG